MTTVEAILHGGATQTTAVDGTTRIPARAGVHYRITPDAPSATPPLIKRGGDDLVVEGLPGEGSLVLEGFFSCSADDPCSLSLENLGGSTTDAITPATRPVAAMADGTFLMYAAGPLAAAVPAAPEAEISFKPALALLGGLAIAAAGGGGGGSAASPDTTAPSAPTVDIGSFTNKAQPVFSGTTEPSALVTLTVFANGPVTWETRAGADGGWRIDTAADTPKFGLPITLIEGIPVQYSVVATGAAGNRSDVAQGSLTLDSLALPAPVITSPLLTGDTTPVIRGIAEPGAEVTVAVDIDRDGAPDAAWTTIAADSGVWSVDLGSPPASGSLPNGQLAPGSSAILTATASDGAGNTSPPAVATLRIDSSLAPPATIGIVSGDDAVNALEAGAPITVGGTLPEPDRPVTVTWGAATLAATVSGTNWTASFSPSQIPPDGSEPIRVTYVSGIGAESDEATRDVLIDRLAPGAPRIASVSENADGGISAAEAVDGTTVRVDMSGTGAAAGDRLLVRAGDTILAEHVITGTEIGGAIASVDISAGALAGLGDGSFALSATIVDYSGNPGATGAPFTVTIDTVAPEARLLSATVIDDRRPDTGDVEDGGRTNDRTPTLLLTLDSVLGSGETLQVYRDSGGGPVLAGAAARQSATTYDFTDDVANRDTYTYSARIVDAAGNVALLPLDYTIRVT
jgi:hypothetical protein